eukprot:TRINITY_DN26102_c0_g1_i2.p1 TRINITY_DN26102_c0_g1~~TRINITY_DN26102_c0_g1_i2.p1  ORF type:complete len:944 (+),score=138.92 TRINITY_DN26102_c0_g1_i2:64-2895(+)
MSCCSGKSSCCDPASTPLTESEHFSRYPKVKPETSLWTAAAAPAQPQFEGNYPPEVVDDLATFTFAGEHLAACNFPLGGIGAGQVILQGDGTLQGWTCLNQPDMKGDMTPAPSQNVPACFFGVSATPEGEQPQSFILATPQNYTDENCGLPVHREAHVTQHSVKRLQRLPGIKSLTLQGRYPTADIKYDIPGFPVQLSLEAMSPLVPGEARNSAYPGAIFTFTATNPGKKAVSVRIMEAQMNFIGWDGRKDACSNPTPFWGGNVNTPFSHGGLSGLLMAAPHTVPPDSFLHGTLCVAAVEQTLTATSVTESKVDDGFQIEDGFDELTTEMSSITGVIAQAMSEEDLWNKFLAGEEKHAASVPATPPSPTGSSYCGAVVHTVAIPPGSSASVSFVLTWHFPNRSLSEMAQWQKILPANLGANYSNWFADALAVAAELKAKMADLLPATRLYRDTVYGSTLPENIIQSAAGRAALMGSPTMWWTKDAIVQGFEGNHCCPLNCSHVYGYTVLMERLFPEWAKDMQYSAFVRTWDDDIGCTMRYGLSGFAIDGALASIIKSYLCVLQSDGALEWLPKVWPSIKKMLIIVFEKFDVDGDGCIRVAQQNTYDSAMYGANTFIGSYYVTALRAASKMAKLMQDSQFERDCSDKAVIASQNYERVCWKEEFGYYVADVTIKNCQNSYGPGCFVDQLCATALSFACGLGYCFNAEHEASARRSIAKHNLVKCPPFKDFQKHFFPGDEGTVTCTYPNGKLGDGMKYDTLVSIGWTYPVIAGMLHDRNVTDAMNMNDRLRQRQDGRNRSPWNEPECNTHYSRMMSGWGLYDQACGFRYDSTQSCIGFDPRFMQQDFKCFFAADGGWGQYSQKGMANLPSGTIAIVTFRGSFRLKTLCFNSSADHCKTMLDGAEITASCSKDKDGITLCFDECLLLKQGSKLIVSLTSSTGYHRA